MAEADKDAANNYPCLMAGVAMGRTLTFAMKAIKQMAGLE